MPPRNAGLWHLKSHSGRKEKEVTPGCRFSKPLGWKGVWRGALRPPPPPPDRSQPKKVGTHRELCSRCGTVGAQGFEPGSAGINLESSPFGSALQRLEPAVLARLYYV